MPRDESKDLMEQSTQMEMINVAKEDNFLFQMNQSETKSSKIEADYSNESMVTEETFSEKNQNENMLCDSNKLTSNDIKNSTVTIPKCSNEETSKNFHLSWNERKSLKIRYTRQYLLDHRYDPLSAAFPDCLFKFLQSREVPLKETENGYGNRSMDHILFYTSLPYTRIRNSLTNGTKRTPFKLCY